MHFDGFIKFTLPNTIQYHAVISSGSGASCLIGAIIKKIHVNVEVYDFLHYYVYENSN